MNPEELSPREAWKRYIDRRKPETTKLSARSYYYKLKLFIEWCEDEQIETVSQLTGWTFETYETKRSGDDLAPITLRQEMQTLKQFIEYLERIEAVEQGLSERVHVPNVDPEDQSSDTKLPTDQATGLLQHYRKTEPASRRHAALEVFWHVGCRLGALRGLDVRDYYPDEQYLDFRHRPETDTPLKNKLDGERPVALSDPVVEVLDRYLDSSDYWEKHDEHGRTPLFASRQGRPGHNTVRTWMYQATLPCQYTTCPHDRDPEDCEWTKRNHSSKCPTSRSPHQIRTGSITWQLDQGIPPQVVSERANVSVETLKKHYDKASARERMERRRRQFIEDLDL